MKKLFLALLLTSPMLAMKEGQEGDSRPCIYLVRSGGGFSQPFVEHINNIPLGEHDKVARCKKTDKENLGVLHEKADLAFFRMEKQFLGTDLKSKGWEAQPTRESIAVLDEPPQEEFVISNELLRAFCQANGFQQGEWIDVEALKRDFEEATGIIYEREISIPEGKCDQAGHPKYQPSLGFIAISYLRNKFPDHKIVLIDFNLKSTATFKGWACHWWEKEDEYARKLEQAGHLVRLMDHFKNAQ